LRRGTGAVNAGKARDFGLRRKALGEHFNGRPARVMSSGVICRLLVPELAMASAIYDAVRHYAGR
jgi:hypothetical protein